VFGVNVHAKPELIVRVIDIRMPTHECDLCAKSFLTASNLTRHMLTHSRDKPFSCEHPGCGARFTQSNDLKKHMRTQHKIEEPKQGAASTVQPPHPLGVVPPSSAAALPNVSLPAGVQVMVLSSSGLVDWSSSLWPSAAQQLHPPTDGIPSAMVEVAPAAAAGATNAMESEAEEMAASAALLLLMGEKDPDGEVEGAIAESEAMEITEEAEVGSTEGAIEESEAMEGVWRGVDNESDDKMEVDDAGAVGALEMAISTAPASSAQPPKADMTASAATRRSPRRRGPKEKVEAKDEEDGKEDLAAVVNWVAMMTTEAAEVAAATAAADGRPAATYSAACWLLRLREACMHQAYTARATADARCHDR